MFKNISDIFFTTILGKLFGFIKIVLLINLYGTSSITDALIVVVSIYWFWSKIIVYSLFSISLIPDISKSNKEEEHINLVIDTIKSVNLISFIAFLKVGLPVTFLTLIIGFVWLLIRFAL